MSELPSITPLGQTPPNRSMQEDQYVPAADAFAAWMPVVAGDIGDAIPWMQLTFEATDQAKQQAAQSAQTATEKAGEASDSAAAAEASKSSAETIAAAVQSAAGLPSLLGNARRKLGVNAAENGVEWQEVDGILSKYEEFTTSGTWTKDPNATWVYVEGIGGAQGGQGGGAHSGGASIQGGEGGKPGYFASRLFRAEDIPATVAATIGAGGLGSAGGYAEGNSASSPALGSVGGITQFFDVVANGGGEIIPPRAYKFQPPENSSEGGAGHINGPSCGGKGGSTSSTSNGQVYSATEGGSQDSLVGGGGTLGDSLVQSASYGGVADNSGSTGGDGGDYAGGGGGGAALNPGLRGIAIAARGGDGGIGSGGGGGGAATCRSDGYDAYYSQGGDGGNGGDGIIRIWQW